jgi:hypothetical protein
MILVLSNKLKTDRRDVFLVRKFEPDHPEYALFEKKMREGREAVL